MQKQNKLPTNAVLFTILLFPLDLIAQASNPLSAEFLEGLPPSVREELTLNNAVEKEEAIEKLFRADTEFDKTKEALEKIRYELKSIEKRLSQSSGADDSLQRFGDTFFSTIQSSFMPVNVPSASGKYIVDVGDTLRIMLTGNISSASAANEQQIVQRDGTINLPGIGKLRVSGLSLSEAEVSVAKYLELTSPGVSSFISLSKVRDIQVIMLGGILSPGIFTLSGGSNILTALNAAGGVSEKGSYRKIEHKRNGETIQIFDLYDVFIDGNINFEDSLRAGDAILVHPIGNSIPVSGGVNLEAIFEALPGETAADLIRYAGGFSAAFQGHNKIFIKRSDLSSDQIIDIPVAEIPKFSLQSRDMILIPSYSNILEPARQVVIEGMVKRPGKYFLNDNERLSDLIKRAGGYKENAYEFGGALFRQNAIETQQEFSQLNYFDTLNFIISNLAQPGVSASPSIITLLSEEIRSKPATGRVVTEFDLQTLNTTPSLDMTLAHNDKIVIPDMQKIIYFFGDFKKPANLAFNPNLRIDEYIKMAGGLNESAHDEIIVIDPSGASTIYQKRLFSRNSIQLYPGSIVYAARDIGKVDPVRYVANVSPILSSLALSLASLNAINN
jgi:protein involved in polysaccharide export with SLBB domain